MRMEVVVAIICLSKNELLIAVSARIRSWYALL